MKLETVSSTLLDVSFCLSSDINLIMHLLNRTIVSRTEREQKFYPTQANKSAYRSSIYAGRRHKFPGSDTMTFLFMVQQAA